MDYFKKLIEEINDNSIGFLGFSGDIKKQFCEDVVEYKNFSIKKHNNDTIRGTDEFCFKDFLNSYDIAINVYKLHCEKNEYMTQFNKLLNIGWTIYYTND